jgi:hypothetical protein
MSPHAYVLCSFALTFGVPMGFAVREYWQLGASPGSLPPERTRAPEPAPLPDPGVRLGSGQRPLPDCLIPKPARVRELA